MKKTFYRAVLLLSFYNHIAFAQEPVETHYEDYFPVTMRYWFDKDYSAATELPYASGTTAIDVNTLPAGFHILHYQVIDNHGATSPVRFSTFFIPERSNETLYEDYTPTIMRYWFDKDYANATELPYASGTKAIDINTLPAGFHTLHYQVIDNHGDTSPVRFSTFFIPERSIETIYKDYIPVTMRYWFDNDYTTMQTAAWAGGVQTLDLSMLSEGIHTMCYQLETVDGEVSPVHTTTIDRWVYDIYVSKTEEYTDNTVSTIPLFAQKPDLKLHFLPDDLSVRGHLTVNEDVTLSLGKFVQTGNLGSQNNNRYTRAGVDYYHPTTLVNNGFMRADSVVLKQSIYRDRWHFITLPFNVNVSDIDVSEDTYWALRSYNGEARAAGLMNNTWTNLRKGDKMEAGQGYILQLTKEGTEKNSWLTFKAVNDTRKNDIFTARDVTRALEEHQAEFAHNRSWNLTGNPYPSFYDTRYIGIDGTIVVWNGNGYSAYSLADDNYVLMPFEAFFIQKPLNAETITFSREGRQHTHEAIGRPASRRNSNPERRILNFTLTDGEQTDNSRVVINKQASMGYEQEKDAPKFMETRPQSVQLFSIESGVQYAINERPLDNGLVTFSVFVPKEGEYRFHLDGDDAHVSVFDTQTNTVWAMTEGDYVFTVAAGWHDARLIVSLNGDATAVQLVKAYDDGEMQVANGRLSFHFAKAKSIKVFGIDGRMLFNDITANANINLNSGVYLIDLNGNTTKIMIK